MLYDKSAWLSSRQKSLFKEKIQAWSTANPGADLDEATLRDFLRDLPDDVSMIVDRVLSLLTKQGYLDAGAAVQSSAKNVLVNDPFLQSIVTATEQSASA